MTTGNSSSIAPLIPCFCYFVENGIMYFLKLLSNLQVYFCCPLQMHSLLQSIFSLPPIDLCLFNLINESRNKMLLGCLILNCHRWISAWTIWKLWMRRGFWQVMSYIPQGRVHRGTDWKSPPASFSGAPRVFSSTPSLPWIMETSSKVFSLRFSAAVPSLTMYLSQASMK